MLQVLKRSSRGLLAAAALATVTLTAGPIQAQDPVAIPRLASGKPDFSGIWQTLSEADYDLEPHAGRRDAPPGPGVVEGGAIPYLPGAQEQRARNFEARAKEDPRLKCWVLGVPRGVYYPAPFQIFQRDNDVTLVHQLGNQVRTIVTNGSDHPEEKQQEFWLGDSRGHWEGDTLVVDVADFNPETWLDRAGNYHSEELHVVERWRFVDPDTIAYSATLDDPKVYSKPWTIDVLLHRRRDANFQLIEDYCFTLQYEQYYPHHKDGQ
ncbi:hypothetical protein [Altererythrobacter sp. Root672]|uniref:hypothetical protein n=1 Tax=Altererythrobacter sp. Root672 TaxID=1736584 RepID=UPI0006FC09DB|nr:hypothetical protein [Altererythrobacter sp. Root672]KRA84397.1 hypothetical protein ASD76_10595 [Altererythrobacter sp. Root672]